MRNSYLLTALLIGAGVTPAAAQPLPPMIDPIFHLTLPPALYANGFEAVSAGLLHECGTAVSPAAAYRYWELAAAKVAGVQYLMIDGVVKDASSSAWSDDRSGAFLLVEGASCTPIDPVDGVFAYYQSYADDGDIKIGKPVFTALAADAVQRYARAFGSKARFVAALHAQDRYPNGPELAILGSALNDSE